MYCKHALATKKEKGRPEGGVTCMYKHTIGTVKKTHTEENMVIIRTISSVYNLHYVIEVYYCSRLVIRFI